MYIKQLVKNKEEYWKLVWPFINWSQNPEQSLWREEDRPKLEPFFKVQNREGNWPQEIKDSFDFYLKCHEEYGKNNAEMRDSVSRLAACDILNAFGYNHDYQEEDYTEENPPLLSMEGFSFPFVVVGDLTCGWDRSGKYSFMAINFVSLEDFK